MDEQRRLIEEMMGGHQREERGDFREFDAIYDGRDHDDDDDRPRRQREFDADAIYGGRDDDDGRYRSDDNGGNHGEYGYVEEGWGPPLANLNVAGLPRSPASKQVVKSTLKQLFTRAVASRDSGSGMELDKNVFSPFPPSNLVSYISPRPPYARKRYSQCPTMGHIGDFPARQHPKVRRKTATRTRRNFAAPQFIPTEERSR